MKASKLAVVLFLALFFAACGKVETTPYTMEIDQPPPAMELLDLDGNAVQLSDYAGQVVLFNYWSLGCTPCLEEFPDFEELYQAYKDEGLVVVTVHWGGPAHAIASFVAEQGYSFDFLFVDVHSVSPALPTSYIIDREGVVRERWIGAMEDFQFVIDLVQPYLNE